MRSFLCLGILFVTTLNAQSFFEKIKQDQDFLSYQDLKTQIEQLAQSPDKGYLALGETHTQNETTHQIFIDLMKSFIAHIPKTQRSKLCQEDIGTLFNRVDFQALQKKFNREVVYQNNSPYRTDFKKCFDKKYQKYVTYSGFFHLMHLTPTFPDLDNNSLARTPRNFINQQMPIKKAFFISQINLYILESLSAHHLLRSKIQNPKVFKQRVQNLISARKRLMDHFEYLYLGANSYESKLGVVLKNDHFQDAKLSAHTFFLVTELEYRILKDYSFVFLKKLIQLDDKTLSLFLKASAKYPSHFPIAGAGLEATPEYSPTICYGAQAGFCFPFSSKFFEMKLTKDIYHLYVATPKELKCYERKKNQAKGLYPFYAKDCLEQIAEYAELTKKHHR